MNKLSKRRPVECAHETDSNRDGFRSTQCWRADGGADHRIADAASGTNLVDSRDWVVRPVVSYAPPLGDLADGMGCQFWQGLAGAG